MLGQDDLDPTTPSSDLNELEDPDTLIDEVGHEVNHSIREFLSNGKQKGVATRNRVKSKYQMMLTIPQQRRMELIKGPSVSNVPPSDAPPSEETSYTPFDVLSSFERLGNSSSNLMNLLVNEGQQARVSKRIRMLKRSSGDTKELLTRKEDDDDVQETLIDLPHDESRSDSSTSSYHRLLPSSVIDGGVKWNGVDSLLKGGDKNEQIVKSEKKARERGRRELTTINAIEARTKDEKNLLRAINRMNQPEGMKKAIQEKLFVSSDGTEEGESHKHQNYSVSPIVNVPNSSLSKDPALRNMVNDVLFSGVLRNQIPWDYKVPSILEGGYSRVKVIRRGKAPPVVYLKPIICSHELLKRKNLLSKTLSSYQSNQTGTSSSLCAVGESVEYSSAKPHFGTIHSYNERTYLTSLIRYYDEHKLQHDTSIGLPLRWSKLASLNRPIVATNPFISEPFTTLTIHLRRIQFAFNSHYTPIGRSMQRSLLKTIAPFIIVYLDGLPVFRTDCVIVDEASEMRERMKFKIKDRRFCLSVIFGTEFELAVHSPWSILRIEVFDKDLDVTVLPELATKLAAFDFPLSKYFSASGLEYREMESAPFDLQYYQFHRTQEPSGVESSHEDASGPRPSEKKKKDPVKLVTRYATSPSLETSVPMILIMDMVVKIRAIKTMDLLVASSLPKAPKPHYGSYVGLDVETFRSCGNKMLILSQIFRRRWLRYRMTHGLPVAIVYTIGAYILCIHPHRWFVPGVIFMLIRSIQSLISTYNVCLYISEYHVTDVKPLAECHQILGMTDFKENRRHLSKTTTKALLNIKSELKLHQIQEKLTTFVSKMECLAKECHLDALVQQDGTSEPIPENISTVPGKIEFINERIILRSKVLWTFRLLRLMTLVVGFMTPVNVVLYWKWVFCLSASLIVLGLFSIEHRISKFLNLILRVIISVVHFTILKTLIPRHKDTEKENRTLK